MARSRKKGNSKREKKIYEKKKATITKRQLKKKMFNEELNPTRPVQSVFPLLLCY